MECPIAHPILVRLVGASPAAPRTGPNVIASAIAHVAAVLGVGLFAGARVLAPAPPETSFPIVFVPAAPALAEAATSLPGAMLTAAAPVVRAAGLVAPRRVTIVGQVIARLPPAAPAAAPKPVERLAAAPAAAAKPPNAGMEAFENQVHQAVQRAAVYPAAARMQRRQGRARIEFVLSGRAIAAARVSQSSQSAVLDRAALEAVRLAALPMPPASLGAGATMSVWVDFTLLTED